DRNRDELGAEFAAWFLALDSRGGAATRLAPRAGPRRRSPHRSGTAEIAALEADRAGQRILIDRALLVAGQRHGPHPGLAEQQVERQVLLLELFGQRDRERRILTVAIVGNLARFCGKRDDAV